MKLLQKKLLLIIVPWLKGNYNMDNLIKFHHFGLALRDFEVALRFYRNLNYDISKPIVDKIQNVELIMCTSKTSPSVELIKPVNKKSPINNYLSKNNEIIYHTCYEIKNYEEGIEKLFSKNRAICISKPKPAILFGYRFVSFYYIKGVGIIEILQRNS